MSIISSYTTLLLFYFYTFKGEKLNVDVRLTWPSSHLFEGAFHVDALVPRGGRVGEAVAGVPPSGNVHLLPAQVPEGLGHHHHPVVRQRRGVLGDERRRSVSSARSSHHTENTAVGAVVPLQFTLRLHDRKQERRLDEIFACCVVS